MGVPSGRSGSNGPWLGGEPGPRPWDLEPYAAEPGSDSASARLATTSRLAITSEVERVLKSIAMGVPRGRGHRGRSAEITRGERRGSLERYRLSWRPPSEGAASFEQRLRGCRVSGMQAI